jgi:hypothetical protein
MHPDLPTQRAGRRGTERTDRAGTCCVDEDAGASTAATASTAVASPSAVSRAATTSVARARRLVADLVRDLAEPAGVAPDEDDRAAAPCEPGAMARPMPLDAPVITAVPP